MALILINLTPNDTSVAMANHYPNESFFVIHFRIVEDFNVFETFQTPIVSFC
jgi:hypothetical protein